MLFLEDDSVFLQISNKYEINDGDDLLIICPEQKEDAIRYTFCQAIGEQGSLDIIDCSLPVGYIALVGHFEEKSNQQLVFYNGKLSTQTDKNILSKKIELIGGMLLDGRKKEYLSPFPPKNILVDGKTLSDETRISVNDNNMTIEDFKHTLNKLSPSDNSYYTVLYQNLHLEFEMCNISLNDGYVNPLGYLISKKTLEPVVSIVDNVDNGLIGMVLPSKRVILGATKRQNKEIYAALCLICANSNRESISVSDEQIENIERFFNEKHFPYKVKENTNSNIRDKKMIQAEAWKYLFRNSSYNYTGSV